MSDNFDPLDSTNADLNKIPMTLSIRDVAIIIAAVLSMTTAWGIFGTRLSVVEEKIIFIGSNITEIKEIIKEIKTDEGHLANDIRYNMELLESRIRSIETNQAQLEILLDKKKK